MTTLINMSLEKKIQELKALVDTKDFETGSGKIDQTSVMEPYMENIKTTSA